MPESLKSKVEALLFAAPSPLKVTEVARLLETPRPAVKRALDQLISEFDDRDGALSVSREGPGYSIVLKMDYQEVASLLMPPELEPAVLKTLSVIAINQPVAQARLVDLRGSTAYDHVKTLVEKGFIRRKRDGCTYIIRTTKTFATRFRLEDDPELIRESMMALEERIQARARADAEARSTSPALERAQEVLNAGASVDGDGATQTESAGAMDSQDSEAASAAEPHSSEATTGEGSEKPAESGTQDAEAEVERLPEASSGQEPVAGASQGPVSVELSERSAAPEQAELSHDSDQRQEASESARPDPSSEDPA